MTNEEAEKLMLLRQQQREQRSKERYDAILHKPIVIIDSEEIIKPLYKKLIANFGLEADDGRRKYKRHVVMWSETQSMERENLKVLCDEVGLPYMKMKMIVGKKEVYYEGWKCMVRFKFVFDD